MNTYGSTTIILVFLMFIFCMFAVLDYGIYEDDSVFERYFSREADFKNKTSDKTLTENMTNNTDYDDPDTYGDIGKHLINIPIIGDATKWIKEHVIDGVGKAGESFVQFVTEIPGINEAMQFFNMAWALIMLDFTFFQELGTLGLFIRVPFLFFGVYVIARLFRGGG